MVVLVCDECQVSRQPTSTEMPNTMVAKARRKAKAAGASDATLAIPETKRVFLLWIACRRALRWRVPQKPCRALSLGRLRCGGREGRRASCGIWEAAPLSVGRRSASGNDRPSSGEVAKIPAPPAARMARGVWR